MWAGKGSQGLQPTWYAFCVCCARSVGRRARLPMPSVISYAHSRLFLESCESAESDSRSCPSLASTNIPPRKHDFRIIILLIVWTLRRTAWRRRCGTSHHFRGDDDDDRNKTKRARMAWGDVVDDDRSVLSLNMTCQSMFVCVCVCNICLTQYILQLLLCCYEYYT